MRKHDVRKWLHAILDLLPVIIIPVFAIYSHRHTIDTYAIEVPQNEIVDFNQIFNFREYDSESITSTFTNGLVNFSIDNDGSETSFRISENFTYNKGDQIYLSIDPNIFTNQNASFQLFFNDPNNGYPYLNNTRYDVIFDITNVPGQNIYLGCQVPSNYQIECSFYCNIFNFTQMFGSGNEPSIEQFNTYYPNDYYDYTLSHKELLNVGSIVYDDTDIGSQMLYCLYNSVDKYFNLNNVFGFNNVYDWLSLNIFNGNPPIAIYIVWNIALYEFLMDLIMLLYALFMWFIDMCEHLIDRSFGVASGRKK